MNTEQKIKKTIDQLSMQLRGIRIGRATSDIVENIEVMAYGSKMRLVEIASIQTPQTDQILIQVWDASLVSEVDKAIKASELNVNPSIEGNSVRITLPPLTQERRLELVKIVKQTGEQSRIAVRNIRENEIEESEKMFKDKTISEDQHFKNKEHIQKAIDQANQDIKDLINAKEKDILDI